jgi:hypothetical protein
MFKNGSAPICLPRQMNVTSASGFDRSFRRMTDAHMTRSEGEL